MGQPEMGIDLDVATFFLEILNQLNLSASDPNLVARAAIIVKAREQLSQIVTTLTEPESVET